MQSLASILGVKRLLMSMVLVTLSFTSLHRCTVCFLCAQSCAAGAEESASEHDAFAAAVLGSSDLDNDLSGLSERCKY